MKPNSAHVRLSSVVEKQITLHYKPLDYMAFAVCWRLFCKVGVWGGHFSLLSFISHKNKDSSSHWVCPAFQSVTGGMVLPRAVRVSASYPCHYAVVFAQRRSLTQNHKTQGRASRRTPNLLPTLSLNDTSCKLFHTCSFQTTHLQLSSPGVL